MKARCDVAALSHISQRGEVERMSQRQQLMRIMEIDRQVRAGKYPNAESLATDLGVSRRVIYSCTRLFPRWTKSISVNR
ncbi:MAG: hypothetical protein ACFLMY_09140 [Candidatus Brachytrichaceae bacterium NZ_4S206]